MRTFYEAEGVTLFHGDCREWLPAVDVDDVGLLLTDPPYGMGYKPLRGADGSKRWAEGVTGDEEAFDPLPLLRFKRLVLFGAHWYADRLPASGGWLVWDKTPKGAKNGFAASAAELAWTNCCLSVRKFSLQWGGEARNSEPHFHPTQKPVALMRWIIQQFTKPDDVVLDPYAGSASIGVACRETGRQYVGIEVEEKFCEVAAQRLAHSPLFGEAS